MSAHESSPTLARDLAAMTRRRASDRSLIDGFDVGQEYQRGGQGVVHRGVERATGRPVAIKVLTRSGHDAHRDRLRFAREVDAMARLRHPNIVTLLRTGITSDGSPYLVMPFLDGRPLHHHVSEADLSVEQTLRLFCRVADAVHHAHQRGVLHRDLKPGNVLVDPDGEPFVLDFGLSKPTSASDAAMRAVVTESGDFAGTLGYAAPEQIRGEHHLVEIRSDVYSLGVVLYTMLTRRHPHDLTAPLPEICERLVTEAPPAPSSHRGGIPEDVDTIVAKAMAKEIERRYDTVAHLVRDIELHLSNRPIEARSESRWYVVRKILARHRMAAAASIALVSSLAIATLVSFTSMRHADQARVLAEQQRAAALEERGRADRERDARDEVSQFVWDILSLARQRPEGREPTLRAALERGASRIDEVHDDPLTRGILHDRFGMAFYELGLLDLAHTHLTAAHAAFAVAPEGDDASRRRMRKNLAVVRAAFGELDFAERELREHLAWVTRSTDQCMPVWTAKRELAHVLVQREAYEEASRLLKSATDLVREARGDDDIETLRTEVARAECAMLGGHPGTAEPMIRRTIETLESRHPGLVRDMTVARNLAGRCAQMQGQAAQAVEHLETSLARARTELLDGDVLIDFTRNNLGGALLDAGRPDAAAEHFRRAATGLARTLGEGHPRTLVTRANLGLALAGAGDRAAAIDELRSAADDATCYLGADHPHAVNTLNSLAWQLGQDGQLREAALLLEDALARSGAADDDWMHFYMRGNLGYFLAKLGRLDDAARELEESHRGLVETLGEKHSRTIGVARALTQVRDESRARASASSQTG